MTALRILSGGAAQGLVASLAPKFKVQTGFDIEAQFPAIHAWRQRLANLPGFVPPYELMNVGNSVMPVR